MPSIPRGPVVLRLLLAIVAAWAPRLLAAEPDSGGSAILGVRHLRAVEAPPSSWDSVFAELRPIRLFWNGLDHYTVEAGDGTSWRALATDAASGWESPPLPRGTSLRLASAQGAVSAEVHAATVTPPSVLARLAGSSGTLPGEQVVDIEVDAETDPWIASLGGGAARLDRSAGSVAMIGTAEGLPSDRVVALAPAPNGAWVATAAGLARVERGDTAGRHAGRTGDYRVTEVIDATDGLPDSYVQALAVDGDTLWVGTYRGLASKDATGLHTVLSPWSVFSLLRGTDGRIWAGYEGLRGLPDAEPIEGVPSDLDVYDLEVLPDKGTLLATYQEGLVELFEGRRTPVWAGSTADGAYAIASVGKRFLVAAADAGMVTIDEHGEVVKKWSVSDGLPSAVVNEAVPDVPRGAGGLAVAATGAWIGTDRGLAYWDAQRDTVRVYAPSHLPAGFPADSASRIGRRLWVHGDEGSALLGQERTKDAHFRKSAPAGLLSAERYGLQRWRVFGDRVEQRRFLRRSRVFRLPFPATCAVLHSGELWVGGSGGALRFDAKVGNFVPIPSLGPVRRMRSAGDTLWVIASDTVVAVAPDGSTRPYIRTRRPLDLAPDKGIVWVGTPSGIDVLDVVTGDVIDLLKSTENRVEVPAVAADGLGGVWAATDQGSVLHLAVTGPTTGAEILDLDSVDPPKVHEIVPVGSTGAWVLTDQGVWALELPAMKPSQRP
jgi:ligand-binding sensor domain-containing protein